MKTSKQIRREARHLFQLCRSNGSLDESRVRQVVRGIVGSKRRGALDLAAQFERLVRLDLSQHTATIESAAPLPLDLQESVQASLERLYGPEISTSFSHSPMLIGGMRIRVGNDVYDGSVKAGLAALEQSL
jgi:F-type H+-transporting ATPase subunit delta